MPPERDVSSDTERCAIEICTRSPQTGEDSSFTFWKTSAISH